MSTTPDPTKPRGRHRREEIEALFALRQRDGLSWKQLAAHSGIPLGTLSSWQQKLSREARQRKDFVEIAPAPARRASESLITLETAAGLRVHMPADFDADALPRLLAAVGSPC